MEKTCTKCGETKPLGQFHRTRVSRDGRTARCAQCLNAKSQEYRDHGSPTGTPRPCLQCGESFTPAELRSRGQPPICCSEKCQDARNRELVQAKAAERVYRSILRRYNLTDERYKATLAAQGGKCGCCGRIEPGGLGESWKVDHDHACCPPKRSCGRCVRGLVCNNCNLMLGHARDSIEVLQRAIAYLKRTQQPALFVAERAA